MQHTHDKKKKILFSANASWYLWNFRRNLMHELEREGYEIITASSRDEYSDRLAAEFSFTEMKFLSRTGMNPIKDFLLMVEYIIVYLKEKPDLVMNLTIKPSIYGGLACRILGIKYVATVTGLGTAFSKNNWLQLLVSTLYKIAFGGIRMVMFQNDDNRELFIEKGLVVPKQSIMVPGSGVDLEKFQQMVLPGSEHKVRFLLIARMLRDKGIEYFANAAAVLKKEFPECEFILAGPLDQKNPSGVSLADIKSWENQGGINYIGLVEDVPKEMTRADVVVLPSWYPEGVPKSLLEAMAMGRPIITTDVPGCRSVIHESSNGILIKPHDADALVDAMRTMIVMNPYKRSEMGKAGRMIAEKTFDQNIVFDLHKKMIREIFYL